MIEIIVRLALKHRLLVFLIALAICIGGTVALLKLPVDAFPDVSPNIVQIYGEVEGMATEEVEQLVTRPVEITMRSIPGVQKIRSLSSLGLSTINIYFEDDVDIYMARQLVSERLRLAEEQIEGVNMPHGLEMGPVASGMGKIMAYYLQSSSVDITELRTIHDWIIKRDIETIPGVAKVISQGGFQQQVLVEINPEQLISFDLDIEEVTTAIERNNSNTGAGLLKWGSEELVVRSLGRVKNLDDIRAIVITTVDGQPIYVRDVAAVSYGKSFRRGLAILDGKKEVVVGGVYKLHRANSFSVIQKLRKRIEVINETLPDGVKIVTYYDQSKLVQSSIQTVRGALLLGLVLVCIIAFMFLGDFRSALIMVCSMPFSILFAMIFMKLFKIPGDLISFGGVAIALGMIIDATIIIVEKIQVTVAEKGRTDVDISETIVAAAHEVGRPILFAVSIIILVFLPIFALGAIEGKMFRPLAFTVTATMLGSAIYALLIAPIFFRIMHRPADVKSEKKKRHKLIHRITDRYEQSLNPVLKRPVLVTAILALLMLAGTLLFFRLGREFVPTMQEGTIQCLAYMNPNISLDQIKDTTENISKNIASVKGVKNVLADIGYGEVGPHIHHSNYACITVTLQPRSKWQSTGTQNELVGVISKKLEDYLGINISFSQPINHEIDGLVAGVGAQVAAKIFGPDINKLQKLAGEVEHILADMKHIADLRSEQVSGQTQLQIVPYEDELGRARLDKQHLQHLVRNAITGETVGHLFEDEKSFRIQVRFNKTYRESIDAIGGMLIRTPDGARIPLRQLARIDTVTGLRQISRENTQRFMSVQCNVRGQDVGTFVEKAQRLVKEKVDLPPGYRIDWGGQFELQQAANRRLMIVIPITLLLVIFMLYGLFNKISNVLLIMLNVPLALVGGILALGIFGENVSIPSSIGFIALFGIALTDGLVLVSRFEGLRANGHELEKAVIEGCTAKFRPVIMTTLTTALGLLPMIIATGTGSEIQRPLAIVVVVGLISSTLLTLYAIPTIYLWINKRTVSPHYS